MLRAITSLRYIGQRDFKTVNLTDGTMTLKEVAACFLFVSEYGWSEQLCGFGTVPFLEVSLVKPNVVHDIGKPSGTERPGFQVAHNLGLYLSDNHTPFFSQI